MRYEACENSLLIHRGRMSGACSCAIARLSYETAEARGLGTRHPHEAPANRIDFRQYIERDAYGRPQRLLLDHVNGRDCRTRVHHRQGEVWHFDAYAFEQRKVDAEEFAREVRRERVLGVRGLGARPGLVTSPPSRARRTVA